LWSNVDSRPRVRSSTSGELSFVTDDKLPRPGTNCDNSDKSLSTMLHAMTDISATSGSDAAETDKVFLST